MAQKQLVLSVTGLSQYVRLQNCERFLRFRLYPKEAKNLQEKWGLSFQPLTPLLEDSGLKFEKAIERQIEQIGEPVLDLSEMDREETVRFLKDSDSPINLIQPQLSSRLGNVFCRGRADVVRLHRNQKGELNVLITDIKASRKAKMEHCLQVATYAKVLSEMAREAGLEIHSLNGSVLHLQEDGSLPLYDPNIANVDLSTYFIVLERLLLASDCLVDRIASAPFEDVFYHLNYRCDGCY